MSSPKYVLEYGFVKMFDVLFTVLPRTVAIEIGGSLGKLFSWFIPKRRRLVLENLKNAFPEKTESDRVNIAQKMWKSIGQAAVEFIRFPEMDAAHGGLVHYLHTETAQYANRLPAEKNGIIFVGFHFGSWEISGAGIVHFAGNLTAVARPMKNPLVEKWVQSKRRAGNMDIILHRNAVKGCLRLLRHKKNVGILVDQNLYTGGVFVNFFGRPAATTTLPALLHDRTQSPLVIAYSLREDGQYKVFFEPVNDLPDVNDTEERIRVHTEMINRHIEKIIRRTPENWFWIHNRWKRFAEAPTS